jgi:hypothetical protein
MKLFSNFDTNLCEVQYWKVCEQYWEDKTLFIRRDKIYLYLKVYHKFFWWVVLLILSVSIGYYSQSNFGIRTGWIIWLVWFASIAFIAIQKWIDRWMDYTIITPRQIIQYDQSWLLDRSTRTLDLAKVKSMNIKKNWLMTSVFDLWDLVFFSEWDESYGDIRLNYIKNPIELKKRITIIMHEALSAQQSSNQETWMLIE